MKEKDKKEYLDFLNKYEGEDLNQVIKIQIQNVIKETARLIGLVEEGRQILDMESEEYKSIREFGNSFLHDLVLTAKKLNIQVQ